MKILFAFFILFFSSSVLAGDDLSGKKLYCLGDPKEAKNYAFIFETENQVKIYETSSDSTYRTLANIEYLTGIDEITVEFTAKITPPNEWLQRYYINRKSLDFIHDPSKFTTEENKTGRLKIITLASCEVTTDDPLEIISTIALQQIENIKNKNKL
tara:strand:+ start:211 stop:678 length:468 start_codon:yes stop_codon:yes gene_type:complete